MRRPKLVFAIGMVIIIATFAGRVFWIWPARQPLLRMILDRDPNCPLAQVLRDRTAIADGESLGRDVASRLTVVASNGDQRLWETPIGRFWLPAKTEWLSELVAEQMQGIYGKPPCRPGDTVLDCGAHVGLYSRMALRAGAKHVVAIEPGPDNVSALRRNFAKEIASGAVIVVEKGVWDREGVLPLAPGNKSSAGDHIADAPVEGAVQVPLTTIDRLVSDLDLGRVDVIKMDIEGAERRALEGALATLSRFRPRLAIASYHLPGDAGAITAIISKSKVGYTPHATCCALWMPDRSISPQVMLFD